MIYETLLEANVDFDYYKDDIVSYSTRLIRWDHMEKWDSMNVGYDDNKRNDYIQKLV